MCADPLSLALASAMGSGGTAGTLFAGLFGGLGGAGTAFTVGSGLLSAYGAIQQGNAAEEAAKATARQQEAAARDSLRQGEEESDRQRRAGAAMRAQQSVANAANGVDLSSASAIETLDDTRRLAEEDAWAIRQNFGNQAKGYAQQAANSLTQGRNAKSQSRWEAAGTLLSTGSKVGGRYAQWSRDRSYA